MSTLLLNLQKQLLTMNPLSILPLFLFLFLLYKWFYSNHTRNRNPPPSPPKLPILGHLHKIGLHPHWSLQTLSNRHGELMLIHLGRKPTLIVSSANAAKEILKTHDAILSNRPHSIINDTMLYNSRELASAPYGEYWRQMKSVFVLQLLSNKRVRDLRVIREEETRIFVESLRKCSSSVVNLSEMFTTLTNDVICRVAFGRKYSNVDFQDFLEEFMELLGVFNVEDYIPWMGWINKLNGLNRRMDEAFRKFDTLIEGIVKEHSERSNMQENNNTKDFVDVLLEVQRERLLGFPIEKESIKALIVDAFAAGTHTTATVLEWAMAELLKNPRVMDQLQKEVRGISKGNEFVTEDSLENMKYLKAVIKETLRLHPPIPLLVPRESTQDLKINGYDIASKTMVIINAWAIQRDPDIWEEPEVFRPERFLDSSVDFKGQDFELIPFGGGRRICPGITFAMTNNELVLANLVCKFNWSLPEGAPSETLDMSEGTGLTIRMKNPLLATATSYTCQ
ncbi:cytochrome P450 736A117-like [Silene latifolia]|uniref:cytochrome P450 736A117-like n=1 Tax=Silene latifolia TaxID=37657 RepID=UPI003D7839FC